MRSPGLSVASRALRKGHGSRTLTAHCAIGMYAFEQRRSRTMNKQDQHTPLRPEQMKRSDILLLLIEERCNEQTGTYYVPQARTEYIHRLTPRGEPLYRVEISGSGDKSALNSLVRKGYVEFIEVTQGYRITEEGKLYAQTLA